MNARELAFEGWPCPTADEMRAVDRHAIEEVGLPGRLLMETAGRAVASALLERFPDLCRPLILCGSGNNGGDGFVVARVLRTWNDALVPSVCVIGDRDRMSEETRANLDLLVRSGVEVGFGGDKESARELAADADLIVDAILGVGITRPVTGPLAELFEAISELPIPIVALDVPSGFPVDTGAENGAEMRADLVVTLGLPKLGLALRPTDAEILVADIGLPSESTAEAGIRQRVLTAEAVCLGLPERPVAAHKGTFGHVLIVAGSTGKTGAACLAAEGSVRGGAGLVTVAIEAGLHPILEQKLTEAMTVPIGTSTAGALDTTSAPQLDEVVPERDAVVVGPGLSTDPGTVELLRSWLSDVRAPTVVDADALNAFAGDPAALRGSGPRLLTPHPGEMGRLLGRSPAEVQADRVGAARELARSAEAVVLLKGARSVIATPEGDVWINPTGGPGLATGGTGDVLAGLLGALLAQGCEPVRAAVLGAYLHGLAGDALGPIGGSAGDVADALGPVWQELEDAEAVSGRGDLRRFP
jgi:NAD(P)H-hydrate epimerase